MHTHIINFNKETPPRTTTALRYLSRLPLAAFRQLERFACPMRTNGHRRIGSHLRKTSMSAAVAAKHHAATKAVAVDGGFRLFVCTVSFLHPFTSCYLFG